MSDSILNYLQKIKKVVPWKLFGEFPVFLEIGITSKCNLNCIMCKRNWIKRKEFLDKEMYFNEFKSVIDQFPSLKMVNITSSGENFLNKDFLKIIKYAKSKGVRVVFYDNFLFLDKNNAESMVNLKVDEIWASIDGATKETYEKIRVGSNFETVINNVKNLYKTKKENNANFPLVKFNYVVNKYNVGELENFVELVGALTGGEKTEIQFKRIVDEKQNEELCVEIPVETIESANKIAKTLGITLKWENLPKGTENGRCKQWLNPFILPTGDILPCCFASAVEGKFLGNIFEKPFKEIWNGEDYKEFKKTLKAGKISPFCEKCGRHRLNKIF